jgi:hypothetical protein
MLYMHGTNYEYVVGKNHPGNPDHATIVYLQIPKGRADAFQE